MPLSPQLRTALILTAGATFFALFLVTRLVTTMMQDPNFGHGDNPFELLSLLACVAAPLLVLVTAMGLAFRLGWARKLGRVSAWTLVVAALLILVSMIVAGAEDSVQTEALVWAQGLAGIAAVGAAVGIFVLLRRLPNPA